MITKLGAGVLLVCVLLVSSSRESLAQTSEAGETYVVRPGDTLGQIAQRYDVPLASIVSVNDISHPDFIWVGQRIIVPPSAFTFSREGAVPEAEGCRRVEARVSAYTSLPGQTWGDPFMTASGYYLKDAHGFLVPEAVIAAPGHYAFGTRIFVPEYGWAVVRDRGGAIVGNRFDVWMHSYRDAINWGVRQVNVTVCA